MKTFRFRILNWLSGGLLTTLQDSAAYANTRADISSRLNEELRRKLYVTEAKLFECQKDLSTAHRLLKDMEKRSGVGQNVPQHMLRNVVAS